LVLLIALADSGVQVRRHERIWELFPADRNPRDGCPQQALTEGLERANVRAHINADSVHLVKHLVVGGIFLVRPEDSSCDYDADGWRPASKRTHRDGGHLEPKGLAVAGAIGGTTTIANEAVFATVQQDAKRTATQIADRVAIIIGRKGGVIKTSDRPIGGQKQLTGNQSKGKQTTDETDDGSH
jgi:hypothetical protein